MLRRWGYFLRAPVKRHVRTPPPDEEIARFQKELAELIPKKIEEGYTVAVVNRTLRRDLVEPFFADRPDEFSAEFVVYHPSDYVIVDVRN